MVVGSSLQVSNSVRSQALSDKNNDEEVLQQHQNIIVAGESWLHAKTSSDTTDEYTLASSPFRTLYPR